MGLKQMVKQLTDKRYWKEHQVRSAAEATAAMATYMATEPLGNDGIEKAVLTTGVSLMAGVLTSVPAYVLGAIGGQVSTKWREQVPDNVYVRRNCPDIVPESNYEIFYVDTGKPSDLELGIELKALGSVKAKKITDEVTFVEGLDNHSFMGSYAHFRNSMSLRELVEDFAQRYSPRGDVVRVKNNDAVYTNHP